ncbi:MAG: AbrB/MazE/SpoVT family DNA-binding domain-containing protein [Clostridia bacterium]|nr:AbrB/MazE/SpoVT family DNA-binding domain-containing protein [Clostridia bacterium]
MKAKGDIRAIDELGRIVVPKTFRRILGIEAGDMLEMNLNDDGEIVITKATPSCVFCGGTVELRELEKKHICSKCVKKLSE